MGSEPADAEEPAPKEAAIDGAAREKKLLEVRLASAKRMFGSVDSDGSGSIDPIEFQRLIRKLDATMSATDVQLALGILDENGDGVIDFEEFASWWTQGDPKENLAQLRKAIDSEGTNDAFTFTAGAANASMKAELEKDKAAMKLMEEMRASEPEVARKQAEPASRAPLTPEQQAAKDHKMKRAYQLDQVFQRFDKDGNGEIDGEELFALVTALGQDWNQEQSDELLAEIDGDGGGTVSLTELRTWFDEFDAGGGGLLGVALRAELDAVLELGAALDDEIAGFLSSDDEEEEPREKEEVKEEKAEEMDEAFEERPMRTSKMVIRRLDEDDL